MRLSSLLLGKTSDRSAGVFATGRVFANQPILGLNQFHASLRRPFQQQLRQFSSNMAAKLAFKNDQDDAQQQEDNRIWPLIDIGANLLDNMYSGRYHGSGRRKHEPDLDKVLFRSRRAGVGCILVTSGDLEQAQKTLKLCREHPDLFTTVGVHPTNAQDFERAKFGGPEAYTQAMIQLARDGMADGKIVAVGEFGLDYDRLFRCDKETQLRHCERHFLITEATGLPMFLHDRNTGDDFFELLKKNQHRWTAGVVHSFTGSLELARKYMELGLYIGVNGCSLKTEENVAVVRELPLDRLMLETDAPWCSIRPTHASAKFVKFPLEWPAVRPEQYKGEQDKVVKMRGEPCFMKSVLQAVAGIKGVSESHLSRVVYENTLKVFSTIKLPPPFPEEDKKEQQQ